MTELLAHDFEMLIFNIYVNLFMLAEDQQDLFIERCRQLKQKDCNVCFKDQTQQNSTTYVSEAQNQKLKSAHLECHQRMLTIFSKTALFTKRLYMTLAPKHPNRKKTIWRVP
uniref:Uncharacterized protein n=1 Tax=Biomphalaria glabrata TaxID=6526 RepID=A0A2C9LNL0_BIOGL